MSLRTCAGKSLKKLVAVGLFLAMMCSLIAGRAEDDIPGDSVFKSCYSVTFGQTEARKILALINDFRTGDEAWYWNEDDKTKTVCTDLEPLAYDYTLEKVAMQRAAEIALLFAHARPNGTGCCSLGYGLYCCGQRVLQWANSHHYKVIRTK